MKTSLLFLWAVITATIIGCDSQSRKGNSLDIGEYLKLGNAETIYPNEAQMEMLKSMIPEEYYMPAPPIANRKYWDQILATESGRECIDQAISELHIAPEVPITDAIYRRANKEGNRGIYKPRYYRTMTRLEHFILAECLENDGRFLPQIEVYLDSIMAMKSWLHPNHDDKDNGVLEGRRVTIDLGARRFASDLALAEVLLGQKLSDRIRNKIKDQLQYRIIDSYLKSCKTLDENNHWIKSTSNWNSVCTSGTLFTVMAMERDHEKRLAAIGSALNSTRYYLSGFGDDGYCSEGAGYWNYGFGHYLYMAQVLHDYTAGGINLFKHDNPQKLEHVANFPYRFQIVEGVCAPFSDGVSSVSDDGGFTSKMVVRKYNATRPPYREKRDGVDSYSAAFQLIEWDYIRAEKGGEMKNKTVRDLPGYTYFDEFGMVISRGGQDVPLSIAIKAGHNQENHNHMDVGTYTVVLGEDIMTGDIGAPSYRAGAFDDDNPARSSWGHPVPRIDNTLQSKGREFQGEITAAEFSEDLDRVVIDIRAAYEIPTLNTLVRTMENDKSGQGVITITDKFSLSEPADFGVAMMTLSDYEIIDAKTVLLKTRDQTLKAEVFSDDGELVIKDELVPVDHLREGAPAYRIGVDFKKPLKEGSITVKYTPVES